MKSASASGYIVNGELKLYDSNAFKASLKNWKDCEVELVVDYYAPRHNRFAAGVLSCLCSQKHSGGVHRVYPFVYQSGRYARVAEASV